MPATLIYSFCFQSTYTQTREFEGHQLLQLPYRTSDTAAASNQQPYLRHQPGDMLVSEREVEGSDSGTQSLPTYMGAHQGKSYVCKLHKF
jgi:hypothetical protein